VQAVRLGRRVFDNLNKAMAYIIAVHVPIAGLSLVPVLLDWPLVLLPMHVVFLELIIDPACSVVFEAEGDESDVMTRPPRNPAAPLFGRRTVVVSLLQGLSVLLIVLTVFGVALFRGQGELDARALTFTTLIIANLGLILANRSWSRTLLENLRTPNAAMWWVFGGATVFLLTVLYGELPENTVGRLRAPQPLSSRLKDLGSHEAKHTSRSEFILREFPCVSPFICRVLPDGARQSRAGSGHPSRRASVSWAQGRARRRPTRKFGR
jgi:magnesium-transporting ATPase (P-type)